MGDINKNIKQILLEKIRKKLHICSQKIAENNNNNPKNKQKLHELLNYEDHSIKKSAPQDCGADCKRYRA